MQYYFCLYFYKSINVVSDSTVLEMLRSLDMSTVEPRYPKTVQTRKKYHHQQSVTVTGVGETYVYEKQYFI